MAGEFFTPGVDTRLSLDVTPETRKEGFYGG